MNSFLDLTNDVCLPVCEFQVLRPWNSNSSVNSSIMHNDFYTPVHRVKWNSEWNLLVWFAIPVFCRLSWVFSKQEPSDKFGLNSVQCLEHRYRHQVPFDDENKFLCSEKSTPDKYVKKLYISTTCSGLFDKPSPNSSIMHINNRNLIQDEASFWQVWNKMILLELLFQNVE